MINRNLNMIFCFFSSLVIFNNKLLILIMMISLSLLIGICIAIVIVTLPKLNATGRELLLHDHNDFLLSISIITMIMKLILIKTF